MEPSVKCGKVCKMLVFAGSKHTRPDHWAVGTYTSTRKCENINFNLISLMIIGLSACYHTCHAIFFFAACARHIAVPQTVLVSAASALPPEHNRGKFPSVPGYRYACECTASK